MAIETVSDSVHEADASLANCYADCYAVYILRATVTFVSCQLVHGYMSMATCPWLHVKSERLQLHCCILRH